MRRIGFIGLGTMGRPMAKNLLKAGHRLWVCDINPATVQALVGAGATGVSIPKEAAAPAEIVITMLPDSPDVERVILGPDGVVDGARPGTLVIDMSTIEPAVTRRIAADLAGRQIRMMDAPVGRPPAMAEQGRLLIMVGGSAEDVAEARPVLEAMGDTIIHIGPLGSGAAMKLVNNYVSTTAAILTAEGLVLGVKAGLKLETMLQVMTGTMAATAHMTGTFPRAFRGNFEPGFKVDLAHKDLGLALSMGASLNMPLVTGAVSREVYAQARAMGRGALDQTAVMLMLEELVGVKVRLAGS